MAFKRYKLNLIMMIILVVITSFALGWTVFSSKMHLAILFTSLVLLETILLYGILTRTNKEILFFFRALENDDTSIRYASDHRNRIINELHQYLNGLNANFRELKISNEIREQYFSRILESISSGLIVIAKSGHVNQINNEALRLFNVPHLTHIRALEGVHEKLHSTVSELQSLDKAEITLQDKDAGMKKVLGLQAVEVNLKGEDVKIITVQDLSSEMERKEINDWIRLIRVMSHEIMNSLAPITSISTTLKEIWSEPGDGSPDAADRKIQQTVKGLDAIADQSEGLTTFFESYRVLSRIPDPVIRDFPVCGMFEKLETLLIHNEENAGIDITFICDDPELVVHADEQMITNVMLNLIKNAVQAMESVKDPIVSLQAYRGESSNVILSITDNGPGIPLEISDEIFMPFFTTHKNGTGVGLSYSRQVMTMNKAKIEFDSIPGRTQFRLVF